MVVYFKSDFRSQRGTTGDDQRICGEGEPDQSMKDRLTRANLFYALILTKLTVRRVPIYKKEWASWTRQMIERAAQVLDKAIEV